MAGKYKQTCVTSQFLSGGVLGQLFDELVQLVWFLFGHGILLVEDSTPWLFTQLEIYTWILTSRGTREIPAGVLARFDVYNSEGHFRRRVDVRCQDDQLNDRLAVLPDGRMIRHRRFVDCLIISIGPGSLPTDERDDEDSSPAVIC